MEEEYTMIFEKWKTQYPDSYVEKILTHINSLKQMATTNKKIIRVAIFSTFRNEQEDLYKVFPDIYMKYQNTNFLINRLNEEDKDYIVSQYLITVEKIGKEFCHVI